MKNNKEEVDSYLKYAQKRGSFKQQGKIEEGIKF